MLCPVCSDVLAFHNEATAQLHYQTWLRLLAGFDARIPVGEYLEGRVVHVRPMAA